MSENELANECAQLWIKCHNIEDVVSFLRLHGASQFSSVEIITKACGLSLKDAKASVFASTTWRDKAESMSEFHKKLEDIVLEKETDNP